MAIQQPLDRLHAQLLSVRELVRGGRSWHFHYQHLLPSLLAGQNILHAAPLPLLIYVFESSVCMSV